MARVEWGDRSPEAAERAVANLEYPHRPWLAKTLLAQSPRPAPQILEVGCGYGANLLVIRRLCPTAALHGLDISVSDIEVGRRLGRAEDSPGHQFVLTAGDMHDPLPYPSQAFDVVFTDASLLYSDPLRVRRVLDEMMRVSRSTVATLELTTRSRLIPHRRQRDGWLHNYPRLLRKRSARRPIVRPLPPHLRQAGRWPTLGVLTLVTLP